MDTRKSIPLLIYTEACICLDGCSRDPKDTEMYESMMGHDCFHEHKQEKEIP